jgi:phenylalanyl-tRNA synthetase alpha chain
MAEEAILGYLQTNEEIRDSGDFAAERGIDHNEMVNVIKSLHGFRYVDAQDIKRESWVLTDEGNSYATLGSPEVQLMLAIPPEGISKDEVLVSFFISIKFTPLFILDTVYKLNS